jgi:hypothetical protein
MISIAVLARRENTPQEFVCMYIYRHTIHFENVNNAMMHVRGYTVYLCTYVCTYVYTYKSPCKSFLQLV